MRSKHSGRVTSTVTEPPISSSDACGDGRKSLSTAGKTTRQCSFNINRTFILLTQSNSEWGADCLRPWGWCVDYNFFMDAQGYENGYVVFWSWMRRFMKMDAQSFEHWCAVLWTWRHRVIKMDCRVRNMNVQCHNYGCTELWMWRGRVMNMDTQS